MSRWDEDIQLKDHIKELEDFIPKGFQSLYRLKRLYGLEFEKSSVNEYRVSITLRYRPREIDFISINLDHDQLCIPNVNYNLDRGSQLPADADPLLRIKMRILRVIYLTYEQLQVINSSIRSWRWKDGNNIEYSLTLVDKQKYPNAFNSLYVRLAHFPWIR